MRNYIIKPLGELYMSDVTCDDIHLALVPVSKKSASVYSRVKKPSLTPKLNSFWKPFADSPLRPLL